MKWISQQFKISVKAFRSNVSSVLCASHPSKSFYYSTDDALLRKAFTDILNCCDIHFNYILTVVNFYWLFEFNTNLISKIRFFIKWIDWLKGMWIKELLKKRRVGVFRAEITLLSGWFGKVFELKYRNLIKL